MRSMWKGAVSFGLVSVPVKMYTATESHDISFNQVHRADGGRIRYQRTCSVCGEEVPYADIAKGYTSSDGQLVILTDDDLAQLPTVSSREIDVDRFVPAEQIDPLLLDKSYYLEPEKTGIKAYALLREALREADRMALVKIAIRQRSAMAVLRVRDDAIVLQTMLWPDEIRDATGLDGVDTSLEDLRPPELAMARSLIETMAGDYEPDDMVDDYRDAVQEMIDGKLDKGEVREAPSDEDSEGEGGAVLDLLAALQKSVAAAKASRGDAVAGASSDDGTGNDGAGDDGAGDDSSGDDAAGADKPATKRSTAKSSAKAGSAKSGSASSGATKKTTAKKATAKKAAPRKSA